MVMKKQYPNNGKLNLDRIEVLYSSEIKILPDWISDMIEQRGTCSLSDVFPSQAGVRPKMDLYPASVFACVQVLTSRTHGRFFDTNQIQEVHQNRLQKYEYKYNKKRYREKLKSLVDIGVLVTPKDDAHKYGLPEGRSVAPVFDRTNENNRLDDIIFEPPKTKKDIYQSTLIPSVVQAMQPETHSSTDNSLWSVGYMLLAGGVLLAVAWAELPFTFSPEAPLVGVLWAMISLGFAMMIGGLLEQLRFGYDLGHHRC